MDEGGMVSMDVKAIFVNEVAEQGLVAKRRVRGRRREGGERKERTVCIRRKESGRIRRIKGWWVSGRVDGLRSRREWAARLQDWSGADSDKVLGWIGR